MSSPAEFDSSTGLPRPRANRLHERILMGVVVIAMALSLAGLIRL